MKTVTLIPGDGIGPEIVESVKKIFKAAGVQIEWEVALAGETSYNKTGKLLPESTLESIKKNKVALKAPLTTPVGYGFRSVNVALRKELDLYANVRPIISLEGVKTKYDNIDLCIVRENTEDLYSGIEHMVGDDAAESIKIITRKGSERIAKIAIRTLLMRNRAKSRLTVVHKANIMKFTDGLFLNTVNKVVNDFGSINLDDRIIDNMCMQLVQRPETFDVIVTENLYGDILSDLCAGLVGGLGVAPGANIGDEYEVYEAIHGTAPDIAGKGIANPTSILLSATMMLRSRHIDDFKNADRIEAAIKKTLKQGGDKVTGDLGGTATTMQFTDAVIANLD
jgi:isocitrate dehydrogenase (NAD+)